MDRCFVCGSDARQTVCQLQPRSIDPCGVLVSFNDIAAVIDAFVGDAYPFVGPAECP